VHWNLTAPFLYERALGQSEAALGHGGALVVTTGLPYRALAARQNGHPDEALSLDRFLCCRCSPPRPIFLAKK